MSEDQPFDFIINGTNRNTICARCGACVVDWHKSPPVQTRRGLLLPNQAKHLRWHDELDEQLA